jgi:hypothetical protein
MPTESLKTDIKGVQTALPWFPMNAEYIDTYNDSVMKYLRDALASQSDLSQDSSFRTTAGLVDDRAKQIAKDAADTPLRDSLRRDRGRLERDVKVVAAQTLLLLREGDPRSLQFFRLLCYLTAVLAPSDASRLCALLMRTLSSESLESAGFDMDDVTQFDEAGFVGAMDGAVMTPASEDIWFEGHGTVRVGGGRVGVFDTNRALLAIKSMSTLRPAFAVPLDGLDIWASKDDLKGGFRPERYMKDCMDVTPSDEPVRLKTYRDGAELTVRVTSTGYDTMIAESTDPAYERLAREVRITCGASNIRGFYMNHFTDVYRPGTLINVTYLADLDCFSIDDTVLDFIYREYWSDDVDGHYGTMDAVLLFPKSGKVMNTWLTREGFLVRSGFEDIEKGALRSLDIVDYSKEFDFLIAEVSDREPVEGMFDELEVRRNFLNYMSYKMEVIREPVPVRKEVRRLDPLSVTLLHRLLDLKSDSLENSSERGYGLTASQILSTVAGDTEDSSYYGLQRAYLARTVDFARRRFDAVTAMEEDSSGLFAPMCAVLACFGREDSDALLDESIRGGDEDVSSVAKLVQASNRFSGSASLKRLRKDLHREICIILKMVDAIPEDEDEDEDESRFPFPPEGESVEHKMSFVFDNNTASVNVTSQSAKCLKTVCAFMNRYAEQGEAHLYMGTDEKRRLVSGVQADIDALVALGTIDPSKGDEADAYMRFIMEAVKKAFPDDYQCVSPEWICDGKVLDLRVRPANDGVVYFHEEAYYRSGSSSRKMDGRLVEEVSSVKVLQRNGLEPKITAVRRAISMKKLVVLEGYDSSSSNTDRDRKVEAFAFTDPSRPDSVWAWDPKDRKNKVFRLRRCDDVKVLSENWNAEKQHAVKPLDVFGFSGNMKIDVDVDLRSVLAMNNLIDQHPGTRGCLEKTGETDWRLKTTLLSDYSLNALASFVLANSDDVDISRCEVLKKKVTERAEKLISRL